MTPFLFWRLPWKSPCSKNAYDTAPTNVTLSWDELGEIATEYSHQRPKRSEKLHHEAMIFGRCEGKRAKANVKFLSGLAADFDIGPDNPRYVSFSRMCDRLDRDGFAFIAYTTTANSAGHNRYRLLMPYAMEVPFELCQAAWRACNAKFGGAIDPSTKDESRLSFMPANWLENPFSDPSKGRITLADPVNAIRINRFGSPILSSNEIAQLSPAPSSSSSSMSAAPLSNIEMLRLSMGKDADAPCWRCLLPADLRRSPLVQPWMLSDLPKEPGNRDYRFMLAVAQRAITLNVPISAAAIEVLADQFSRGWLHREPPHDALRQAENALVWAFRNSAGQAGPCQPDADI